MAANESVRLACLHCGQANRVPAERLDASPKCGTCGQPLVGPKVVAIAPDILDKAIRTDDLPLVLDVWAPWCGPCRSMAPNFAEAARQLAPRVRLAKIDSQAHPEISTRLRVSGIPLLIRFQGGRETGRIAGLRPAPEITRFAEGETPR